MRVMNVRLSVESVLLLLLLPLGFGLSLAEAYKTAEDRTSGDIVLGNDCHQPSKTTVD